ncbi:hypothetical protein Q5P01_020669 [Channa striata]|uniref:Glycosyltransferase family 92 protein n=1 Tax=Channa striata TaxID=64152 RepID=A0AA88M0D8_CHASR|nr:hypothetical protein Q5P01_020669 [Channa striata]
MLQFAQTLEVYRLLGVNRVVIYNTSCGPDLERLLQSYSQEGFVELVPWPIDRYLNPSPGWLFSQHGGDVHYFGQLTTLNECIYRSMDRSRYVLLNDIDEIIMPYQHRDLKGLMDMLQQKHPNTGVFLIENHIFPKKPLEENKKGPLPQWKGVPGYNILEHIYREEPDRNIYHPHKMIVQPRFVEQTSVHDVLKMSGEKFKVPPDVCRIIHCPISGPKRRPLEQLHVDTRLWDFKDKLIPRVNEILTRVGLLGCNGTELNDGKDSETQALGMYQSAWIKLPNKKVLFVLIIVVTVLLFLLRKPRSYGSIPKPLGAEVICPHQVSEQTITPLNNTKHFLVSAYMDERHGGDVHYFGQLTTLNECIYRSMDRSRYVLLNDIDEIIMPYQHSDLKGLMDMLQQKHPNTGVFLIENHIFPKKHFEPSRKFNLPQWKGVPGVNILEHIYREDPDRTISHPHKMIVQPKMVEQTSVHEALKYFGESYKVPLDVCRIIHVRVALRGSLKLEQLNVDKRLWDFQEKLISKTDEALKRAGLL